MNLYKPWAFIRQAALKIGIDCEELVFKISKGKHPKALFSKRAGASPIETNVKIISENEYSTDIAKVDKNGDITDEDFVILSTTDFHFDKDYELNAKTVELFVRQIKDAKPDLIVLTGDIITSKYQQSDAIKFGRMMEEIGIYWTAVFGNHEVREEKGFYKWLLLKDFADFDHCLCKHGPKELFGYGNHTINILGSGGKLKETVFLFDTGRSIIDSYRPQYNLSPEIKGYDFLKKEQIDFYKNETKRLLNKYGSASSLMFMHIPLKEYEHVFKEQGEFKYVPTGECEILYGEQYESVGSSPFNSGMFDAVLETGTTKAIYAGHDHINDWCAIYKGVYLVYSLPAGYNPYHLGTKTNKPESEWMQGVTLTTVHSDGAVEIKSSYNRKYLNGGLNNGK